MESDTTEPFDHSYNVLYAIRCVLATLTVVGLFVFFFGSWYSAYHDKFLLDIEVQKVEQRLKKEQLISQIKTLQIQNKANDIVNSANAEAYKITALGVARASAIKAQSEALKITPAYIQYLQTIKWNGVLPKGVLYNTPLVSSILDPKH